MFFLLLIITAALCAERGVDVSTLHPDCKCLKADGYSFFIPRCYQSNGRVDRNCGKNIDNANAAGLKTGVYIFPCVPCGNPEKQIAETIAAVGSRSVDYYWVDVEKLSWTTDKAKNRAFIKAMVDAITKHGKKPAIYSNYYMWQEIVGLDWSEMSHLPLWYAHYSSAVDCKNYRPFGGWRKPMYHQYKGTTTLCNGGVDLSISC